MRRPGALPVGAIIIGCALLDGIAGAAIGAAIALALVARTPPRSLLLASVATLVLAGVHAVVVGLPEASQITVRFITDRMMTHHLAFGGAALLVVGVLADELLGRPEHESS